MADPIVLQVLTESGLAFEDKAVSVIAPAELGYLGVLSNHAPLVTTLRFGKLTWRKPDGASQTRLIDGGVMEIAHNRLTILTQSVSEPIKTTEHSPL
ncbi:MAG: hypothetical protein HYT88_04200 [Candidatus Omnitrophica bacterium]|nr:hypothetical protein [Candidatus Omnitrophota bacterium]